MLVDRLEMDCVYDFVKKQEIFEKHKSPNPDAKFKWVAGCAKKFQIGGLTN